MLNVRHHKFLQEFLKGDCSAAEAARRTGYSPKSARFIAYKILQHPEVQKQLSYYYNTAEVDAMSCIMKAMEKTRDIMDKPDITLSNITSFLKLYYLVLEKGKQFESWY